MSAYLDRLYDEYRRAAKTGQDVMDLAASENRELDVDEITTRDTAFEAVTKLKAEIDKVAGFETLRQAGDAFREVATPVIERATGKAPTDGDLFRAVMRGKGEPTHDSNLPGYSSRISPAVWTAVGDPSFQLRALQSAGGSAVETSFADFVTVYQRTFSPMLRPDIVTILPRTDGSPLVLPRLTADPNHGGTITAEAGGINEIDPTISSIQLNPYKYAATNLWSSELAQDNTIGLENLIAFSTGRELGLDIGAALTTGDGSGKPQGFVGAATVAGTAVGTSATLGTHFGPDDLITLFYSLEGPYRTIGSWQVNSTSLSSIRKSSATDGQKLWQPSLVVGAPETVLGRPIYENPAMASGSAAKAVAFGDFSAYKVVRVVPIRVESSIHYKYSNDQVALRTVFRVDGACVDTASIRYLVNAAV